MFEPAAQTVKRLTDTKHVVWTLNEYGAWTMLDNNFKPLARISEHRNVHKYTSEFVVEPVNTEKFKMQRSALPGVEDIDNAKRVVETAYLLAGG